MSAVLYIIICMEGTSECPLWRVNKWDWRTLTKVGRACEVVGGKTGMPGWNVSASEVHPQWLGRWSLKHLVVAHRFLSLGKSHRCQHHCYCILWAVVVWRPHTPDMAAHTGAAGAGCLQSEHLTPALSKTWLCLKKTLSCFKGKSAEISDQKLKREFVSCACVGERMEWCRTLQLSNP